MNFADAISFKQWADKRTLAATHLIDTDRYPEALVKIRQQLNHMVIVEELFKSRLLGEKAPHHDTNTEVVPELAELESRLLASGQWFSQFYGQRDASLDDVGIAFEFADGRAGSMSQSEMLFHIVNHSSYHRGTIARVLDVADVDHPADIFTQFIHEVEPERRG